MATITNPNDPNKDTTKPIEKTTVNSASPMPMTANPAANSGVPVGSGQFSTLQKYLGANKDAGSRIANQLGGKLSSEAATAQNATASGIDQAQTANDAFKGLTTETQGLQSQLSQGTTTQTQNDPTKSYDVANYNATVSGQQAAKDIAANQASLENFAKIRDDKARAESYAKSDEAAKTAQTKALNQEELNKQRQKDVSNESNRQNLLANILNTKNQRQGIQSLDNAFLSLDKDRSVNAISNQLKAAQSGIQANKAAADAKAADITGINTNQVAAQQGLVDRLTAMQQEYDNLLTNRMTDVNAAKEARMAGLTQDFADLRDKQEATADFANLMRLQDVSAGRSVTSSPNQVGIQNDPFAGVNLYDTLKSNDRLEDYINTDVLKARANSNVDVLNQNDIDALQAIRAISGMTPGEYQQSRFTGEQLGESTLGQAANERALAQQSTVINPYSGGATSGGGFYLSNPLVDRNLTVADYLNIENLRNQTGYTDRVAQPGTIYSNDPAFLAYQNALINAGYIAETNGDQASRGVMAVETGDHARGRGDVYNNFQNLLNRLKIKGSTNG